MKNRSIAVALLLLGITACTGFKSGSVSPQNAPTTLQVDNQGFLDMTVYAIRNSQRVRLGSATGNSKTNLAIPSNLVFGLTPFDVFLGVFRQTKGRSQSRAPGAAITESARG